jgi:predicted patatin/cPLA2 family phospholipase
MDPSGTGLVLEGGGFRGIYTAGVLDVFLRENLHFNYVVGVSAGAAYGVSYVSGQVERNLALNKFVADPRYCGWKHYLKNGNYFNWDFVYNEVPVKLLPFSFEEFSRSGIRMEAVLTNCGTGRAEYFQLDASDRDQFRDLLIATSSLPFISKGIKIGKSIYMDGGLADAIPVKRAFEQRNRRAVVILTRPEGYRKKPSRASALMKWVYRRYPEMVKTFLERTNTYNRTLDELEEMEKNKTVFLIRPDFELPVSRMENDPVRLTNAYNLARKQMEKMMQGLREWLG